MGGSLGALRAAVALVVVCAFVLTGCGDEEASTTAGPTSTAAADPDPPELEPAPSEEEDRGAPSAAEGERAAAPQLPLSAEEVIAAVLTRSGSPHQGCEELVTEGFVRGAYGDTAGCMAAREQGGLARGVEIARISERGDAASAVAVPDGGPYDGLEVEVELVRDPARSDAWLVDSLLADVPAGP